MNETSTLKPLTNHDRSNLRLTPTVETAGRLTEWLIAAGVAWLGYALLQGTLYYLELMKAMDSMPGMIFS